LGRENQDDGINAWITFWKGRIEGEITKEIENLDLDPKESSPVLA
jgi:hypothetical protein